MLPYFREKFGNAASRNHPFGWEAEEGVTIAREQCASIIGADPKEIVFTSGSTESNNIAIKGAVEMLQSKGKHIITALTEHKAVLDPCKHLEALGFEATYLPVDKHARVSAEQVAAAIRPRHDPRRRSCSPTMRSGRSTRSPRSARFCKRRRRLPHRRDPGRRQGPGRCAIDGDRSPLGLRPQDLRAEGLRVSLRSPQVAARPRRADLRRRRPRARDALRHPQCPRDRWAWQSVRALEERDGEGHRALFAFAQDCSRIASSTSSTS